MDQGYKRRLPLLLVTRVAFDAHICNGRANISVLAVDYLSTESLWEHSVSQNCVKNCKNILEEGIF